MIIVKIVVIIIMKTLMHEKWKFLGISEITFSNMKASAAHLNLLMKGYAREKKLVQVLISYVRN